MIHGTTAASTTVDLGPVTVRRIRVASFVAPRSHRSGPGSYQLILAVGGRAVVRQRQREARLVDGDLALYDTSRPFHAGLDDDGDRAVDVFLLDLPAVAVPVAPAALEDLVAVRLPGRGVMAQILSDVLCRLTARPEAPPPADAARLSAVVLDLVGGVVATGSASWVPESPGPAAALLLRIHEYIDQSLDRPDLTPPRIAAAHHISVRSLHQLFQRQGLTVAGWVRRRRLEACRRDLADPRQDARPVHAIAARWGFADESHFGRVFRAAFGVSPAAWRRAVRAPRRE